MVVSQFWQAARPAKLVADLVLRRKAGRREDRQQRAIDVGRRVPLDFPVTEDVGQCAAEGVEIQLESRLVPVDLGEADFIGCRAELVECPGTLVGDVRPTAPSPSVDPNSRISVMSVVSFGVQTSVGTNQRSLHLAHLAAQCRLDVERLQRMGRREYRRGGICRNRLGDVVVVAVVVVVEHGDLASQPVPDHRALDRDPDVRLLFVVWPTRPSRQFASRGALRSNTAPPVTLRPNRRPCGPRSTSMLSRSKVSSTTP